MAQVIRQFSLDDRYTESHGTVLLTGIQALVRLTMLQHDRDAGAGLNTAGFISGYRGSPLGGLDREIVRQKRHLDARNIKFQPGVNEELGVLAVWGSQQVNLYPGGRYDGVIGLWYGKGAGVDRCGDVLRHGNAAGVSPYGGVLVAVGDDHLAKSSSQPHNCEMLFADLQIPLLYPASVAEVLELGLAGYALSRYSGCWFGMKILPEVADALATVDLDAIRKDYQLPPPAGDVHIRVPDPFLQQETRLVRVKREAALRFARLNRLDRVMLGGPRRRLGIVASGKSYLDVLEALRILGVSRDAAAALGLAVYKVAMPTPLEPEGIREFAEGLEEIVVIEEKRPVIEQQIKDFLYDLPAGTRPAVYGKHDRDGSVLIPRDGEATPDLVAAILAERLIRLGADASLRTQLRAKKPAVDGNEPPPLARIPFYCPGCPHNLSTKVLDGSRVISGIGCHSLSQWMDRRTDGLTPMGGEGVPWIGQAPFTDQPHVFTNVGDGTYYHSGILAIRAAVAANASITFRLLFNDAVAMTGGQPFDGPMDVPQITRQLAAEGVKTIALVADDPDKYPKDAGFAPIVTIDHRDAFENVERRLRDTPGTSVLIYDQTCAAEKRRRRKAGKMEDPDQRVFINEAVCEGCGDCSVKSNCIAVEPSETALGRKRKINQSACNKDFSCIKGFCPSFVMLSGAKLKKRGGGTPPWAPDIEPPALVGPWRMLIPGIGGTGVVTVSALLGTAAHLEGKLCSILDQTGMAQKGGAVVSHVTLAIAADDLAAVKTPLAGANVLLGADMLYAADPSMLAALGPGTKAVVNADQAPTGEFVRNRDLDFREDLNRRRILRAIGGEGAEFIPATRLATELLGDAIAANLLLVGFAWQKGLIPISAEAILKAIELNGVAVGMNKAAFGWGRALANDRASVEALLVREEKRPETLEEIVAQGEAFLTAYQSRNYARRYVELVRRVEEAERQKAGGMSGLAIAVARNALKLMSYKDEYEVARLYTDGSFAASLRDQFEDGFRMRILLAPPFLARRDPNSGEPKKIEFGEWILPLLNVLKRFKWVRGTAFDPFGRTAERRLERELIADYETAMQVAAERLTRENHDMAVRLASLPDQIRGFGHVKAREVEKARPIRDELIAALAEKQEPMAAAE